MGKLTTWMLVLFIVGNVIRAAYMTYASSVGLLISVYDQQSSGSMVSLGLAGATFQAFTFFLVARESKQMLRWHVAASSIALTVIVTVMDLSRYARMGQQYLISGWDVACAIIFALVAWGSLVWLRRKPVVAKV